MKHALLLLAAAALVGSCKSSGDKDDGVPFRTLARGYQSGITEGGLHVARDEAEWRVLWLEHTSTVIPRPPAPSVDWKNEMVVCVMLGARPSGGYGVEITKLVDDKDALIVEAREHKPAPDAIEPMLVTQPYHMIATARRDGRVELAAK
jgi:hypothetical protein